MTRLWNLSTLPVVHPYESLVECLHDRRPLGEQFTPDLPTSDIHLSLECEMANITKALSIEDLKDSKKLANRFTAARPSIADRMASGKRLRTAVPQASLAEFRLPRSRKNPVAILEAQ